MKGQKMKTKRSKIKRQMIKSMKRSVKLLELSEKIIGCRKCSAICDECVAPGWGNPLAKTMLVGQSLHSLCLETKPLQVPFIGPMVVDSGDVLFDGILKAGLSPFDFFITNIVKHHASRNRPNERSEEQMCHNFFVREIAIIRPKLVIALGRQASDAINLASKKTTVSKHGKMVLNGIAIGYEKHSVKFKQTSRSNKRYRFDLLSVNHPSYAMRGGPDAIIKWKKMFSGLLKKLNA